MSKADQNVFWAFHFPVAVNVLLDPFSQANQQPSTAWILRTGTIDPNSPEERAAAAKAAQQQQAAASEHDPKAEQGEKERAACQALIAVIQERKNFIDEKVRRRPRRHFPLASDQAVQLC
jgi:hypothetical protein